MKARAMLIEAAAAATSSTVRMEFVFMTLDRRLALLQFDLIAVSINSLYPPTNAEDGLREPRR